MIAHWLRRVVSYVLRKFTRGTGKVTVQPLRAGLMVMVGPYLWLVSAAVWIILCVACVNLATLLLARGRSRNHEVAVRVAIGVLTGGSRFVRCSSRRCSAR